MEENINGERKKLSLSTGGKLTLKKPKATLTLLTSHTLFLLQTKVHQHHLHLKHLE